MTDWILIYNNGNTISVEKSKNKEWNQAKQTEVQFLIIVKPNGLRHAITGMDNYNIPEPNSNAKQGSFISDAEYKRTRDFMIYGDY